MKSFLFFISLALIGFASFWPVTNQKIPEMPIKSRVGLVNVSDIPILRSNNQDLLDLSARLSAQTAYVLDLDSGTPLFNKDADKRWFPASTTKLMTALVARQVYAQQESLVIGQEVFIPGNKIDLVPGTQIEISELLYGLLVASGNDVAQVLAAHHPGGYQGFITQMNDLANQMGLKNTNFENPSGLDAPNQFTTARDLALIGKRVYHDSILRPIVSTKNHLVMDVNSQPVQQLWNTNALLGNGLGVVGGKTGTTQYAGQVLVSFVEREGRSMVVVVMGSQDRYQDTSQIIETVFNTYDWIEFDTI